VDNEIHRITGGIGNDRRYNRHGRRAAPIVEARWMKTAMMTNLQTAIPRYSFTRPRRTLLLWLVGPLVLILLGVFAGGELGTEDAFTSDPESVQAARLLGSEWGTMDHSDDYPELLVVESGGTTLDDPAYETAVDNLVASLEAHGAAAVTWYQASAAGDDRAAALGSADGTTTIIPYRPGDDIYAADDAVRQAAEAAGFDVHFVSEDRFDDAMHELTGNDLVRSEVIGLPAALLVLIVVFGALVAAGLPIVLSVVSMVGAIGLTLLLGRVTTMSIYALNMISMFGLAIGVDYALFIVDRFREERRAGHAPLVAIERTAATAGRAVLFSGVTVAISLLGMFLLPTTLFRSLAAGAILVVLVALLATVTLLPALLALSGSKLDWPRRNRASVVPANDAGSDRLVRLVLRRPGISAVLAVAFLVVLALPALSMERGSAGIESMPPGDLRDGYEILARDFAAGMTEPVEIVIAGSNDDETNAAIDSLLADLSSDGAFATPTGRAWNDAGTVALIDVPLAIDGNTPEAYAAIERLRSDLIPAAFSATDAEVLVGGDVAETTDLDALVDLWTPRVLALVLGLSFVVLLLAFRSIVVPVKAILLNVLSVAAAYGAMVFVFQQGHGVDLFGFQQTPTIEAWIPIFLFSILFGLSMDYHIFLLSRIREAWDRSGNNSLAVAEGLHSTRRIITGAAAIMVVVFAAFATADLVMFQQLGFGLAVAILLDATIIRLVLVPASMRLLGNWNWYFPRWLEWLPRVQLESTTISGAAVGGD
jgi:RND superfamily putative drug exporter